MPTLIKKYNCGQQELYAVCRLGWDACSDNLADFTAFKSKYDAPFIAARLAEIDAAEALPDEEQRTEDARTFRIELKELATAALAYWQKLKRYITDAFPASQVEVKLDAAGQAHYAKAGKDDWNAVARLMLDGNTFITDNSATLQAGGNMPAAFAGDFEDARDDFDDKLTEFLEASQSSEVSTQTKITANNDIHAKLMNMFLDGQEIYKTDEAVKKLFTFEQVLLTVAGPGNQGYKGNITQTNNANVTGGTVEFSGLTNKTVQIDVNGHYNCPQLSAGPGYTITVTVPACEVKVIENVEVETGVMKTLNIQVTSNPS